jgi:polyisoprenoid-binding protein YceI
MAAQTGSRRLGPENASLKVKTYREGLASKAGHDLIIEVTRWEATLAVGEDGTTTSIDLSADPASLEVREGHHGVKPLTDKDRDDIRKNIDKKVLGTDPISFTGSGGAAPNGRLPVSGDLTMAGTTRPVSFELETGHDGRIRATCSLSQSEWGIKPYSGLMGTLKVRDSVDLVAESG